jgi:hypothetical protein
MTDYTTIPDETFDAGNPVLGSTILAMHKNLEAAGAGADDAPKLGGLLSFQVFTSSGTWTRPAGCKAVKVIVTGGGGGGGGSSSGGSGGTSSFGAHCSATGGGGGGHFSSGAGGSGGGGVSGNINISGGSGGGGYTRGGGGASFWGGRGAYGSGGSAWRDGAGGGGAGGTAIKYITSGLGDTEAVTVSGVVVVEAYS